ncbi:long-chain-acyl-CoA synthetase [Sphingomonas sanxanigenens]|uniref:Long-chain-acyl-CoA synthetase n=1 Tax=Sphingomonas sanxanigenens DSM 19645 = NX02 TaxID=1123269 RepID=W0AHH5_9SPHN|nr:long-chain-acyl-CoA synthetase [Sphingomonas sanxanigenens]AHE55090.1 long-chain-acyl-CoA synthetase [Sphingomonas sanxanigenens DSM 19645 = NX02]
MSSFVVPSREESMRRLMRGYQRVAGFARDMAYTTADRLEERAGDAADTPFILFEDQAISFAEMNARANRVAHAARAAGLAKGDVVALLMLNRPEFVMIWLGLAKAGIVTTLLNTSATGAVLGHALRQVEATALIVGSELAATVDGVDPAALPGLVFEQSETGADRSDHGWRDLDAAMATAFSENPPRAWRRGVVMADPLYLIFTSGTTGLPKAARMSHMRFLNAGEMMAGLMQFGAADVHYCVLPLYHGAGGMVVPSVALAAGRPFVLRRKFSRSGFWADVRRHGITAVYYIGEVVRYLMATPPSPDDRDHSLRVMSGAGLKPDVWAAFSERFGVSNIIEGLGSTEANYGITNVDNRPGSVGRLPYPQATNIRVLKWDVGQGDHVRAADGSVVEAGPHEVGELVAEVLDGTGVAGFFEGYTSAEATEAKLIRDLFKPGDRWFRSGDLVRFDEDDYFFFVDRAGDTFRWKSENVSTQEVETVLSGFAGPSVINVYGVAVPGAEGRAGMAALTYDGGGSFDGAAFHAFATAHLAPYAVPLFVRLTASADMTTTFKLRKIELQREGYDPARCGGDPLFVADPQAGAYVPLDEMVLARLGIAPFAGPRS